MRITTTTTTTILTAASKNAKFYHYFEILMMLSLTYMNTFEHIQMKEEEKNHEDTET